MLTTEFTGFLLVNKPRNISSFDCIRYLKKLLPKKTKIGHAGTLDTFATGLLIIALGRQATKKLTFISQCSKEYKATAKLGELTTTLDHTGHCIVQQAFHEKTADDLQKAVATFPQQYLQTPPAFSALKFQGKPLYELARYQKISNEEMSDILKGKTRPVSVHTIMLTNVTLPFFTVKAVVSKGTYVRSLMNDIAQALELNATTYELERMGIGRYTLEQATLLYDFKTRDDIANRLHSINDFSP